MHSNNDEETCSGEGLEEEEKEEVVETVVCSKVALKVGNLQGESASTAFRRVRKRKQKDLFGFDGSLRVVMLP